MNFLKFQASEEFSSSSKQFWQNLKWLYFNVDIDLCTYLDGYLLSYLDIYLEASALIGQFPDPVQNDVNDFLADGVVSSGVVVSGVFLSGDELLWVEQLTVCAGSNLVWNERIDQVEVPDIVK